MILPSRCPGSAMDMPGLIPAITAGEIALHFYWDLVRCFDRILGLANRSHNANR